MRHSFSTQEVFGVSSALFGLISKESILTSGITQSLSEFKGAPRYEGEIGFRMKAVDLDTLIQTYPFNKENVIPFIKNIM